MDGGTNRIVPMRLFANWETDRTSTSAVQRMFSMALTRLIFNSFPEQQCTLVITVKMQGSKRSLRSNDFSIQTKNGRVDLDINISFTIQYPHFLKRKRNILQILLQRRKRYKNRPILGYKTLAIGTINLSEVMQNCSVREIALFDPDGEKDEMQNINSVGRLVVASCQSQAFEAENEVSVRRIKDKELESEDDIDSSSDGPETNDEQELPESARLTSKQRYKSQKTREQKLARRKNLKQKFSSFLKKFKVPEEDSPDSVSRIGNAAPTAQELEELFEELDNLSDSGPEMVMDNLSIVSNPRPGLRPYFASSSREVLPSITDDKDNTEETDSDEEVSTDMDNLVVTSSGLSGSNDRNQRKLIAANETVSNTTVVSTGTPNSKNMEMEAGSMSLCLPDSDLTITAKSHGRNMQTLSVTDWLSAVIRDEEPWTANERLWLCDNSDIPVPPVFGSIVRILDCSSFSDCRLLISSVVAKIQKFCNSSSSSPPCTVLGIIGSEKLVSLVLRAYVELLQNKPADWINFLRFCMVTPACCPLGKILQGAANGSPALSEFFTRNIDEFSASELKAFAEKLRSVPENTVRKLSIGEAMLQLYSKAITDEKESSQFVPFLSEVRVGQFEEDLDCYALSPRHNDDGQGIINVQQPSPPSTPHNPKPFDTQDLLIEYWISNNRINDVASGVSSAGGSSVGKREPQLLKCSIRSAFRSFTVFRKSASSLLSIQFVKERRRDKMFHKLGMKKVQRSESDNQAPVQCINNVARLICSGKHKLTVSIDGCIWSDIRFFQISTQWQTHVKYFPVCLLPPDS